MKSHQKENTLLTHPIGRGYYLINEAQAEGLTALPLPWPGYERKCQRAGRTYWLSQQPYAGGQAWMVRPAGELDYVLAWLQQYGS